MALKKKKKFFHTCNACAILRFCKGAHFNNMERVRDYAKETFSQLFCTERVFIFTHKHLLNKLYFMFTRDNINNHFKS